MSAALILTAGDRIRLDPALAAQVDAVLEYYGRHSSEDPLCRGERAERRLAVLQRLKRRLAGPGGRDTFSLERLQDEFDLRPVNSGKPVRLTRYAAFTVPGRRRRSGRFDTPLLDLPDDERNLSEARADARRSELIRFRHSKREILDGVLANRCRPLAWLTRSDFESALMQGSVRVRFGDGASEHFNVSRSNDMAYLPGVNASGQRRYWFFKAVRGPLGYGRWSEWQLPIHPMSALAGDLKRFGLGAVVLLRGPRRTFLAVLADTGGAFNDNRDQFDLFLGTLENRSAFRELNRSLPERVEAFVLE